MKIIALDCDGVINSNFLIRKWLDDKFDELKLETGYSGIAKRKAKELFFKEFCHSTELVFPELAEKITDIVNKTGCKIVWSSSWRSISKYRKIEDAREMFNRRGLPGESLIGYTPDLNRTFFGYTPRGTEISSFIRRYNQGDYIINQDNKDKIERCAVVDDIHEAGDDLIDICKFFQTSEEFGITDEIKNDIITYLNK